jgi:hypothetical protein
MRPRILSLGGAINLAAILHSGLAVCNHQFNMATPLKSNGVKLQNAFSSLS